MPPSFNIWFEHYLNLESLLHTDDNSLTTFQFLMVALCREINPVIIAQYFHLVMQNAPGKVFITYMFETFFISIPMYTILLFLGSYSKIGMIGLWNWIPVFKGCGYVLVVTHSMILLLNQHVASYIIHLLTFKYYDDTAYGLTVFESMPIWSTCSFPEADDTCLPKSMQFTCDSSKYYEHHLMQFTRKVIYTRNKLYDIFPLGPINVDILIIQIILWILNGTAVLIGARRTVTFFMIFLVPSIILQFFMSTNVSFRLLFVESPLKRINFLMNNDPHPTKIILYFLRNLIYASGVLQTGSIIWLGSLKPEKLRPLVATLIIFCLKLLIFLCFSTIFKHTIDIFAENNKHILGNCNLYFDELSKLCTFLDAVMEYRQPTLWLLFYIGGYAGITIMDNMLGSILLYESITDEIKCVKKYHILATACFTSFCCVMSVIFTTRITYTIWYIWMDHQSIILGAIIFVFITLIYNYFYTSDLIATDYLMIYKEALPNIIARAWTSMPVLALFFFASVVNWFISNNNMAITKLVCLSITFMICLPPALVFSIRKSKGISVSPDVQNVFASQDQDLRLMRMNYKYDRDIAFRYNSARCTHTCLLKAPKFKLENAKQKLKFDKANKLYNKLPFVTEQELEELIDKSEEEIDLLRYSTFAADVTTGYQSEQ